MRKGKERGKRDGGCRGRRRRRREGKRGERTVVQLFKHTFQQCSHMHANSTELAFTCVPSLSHKPDPRRPQRSLLSVSHMRRARFP